jgi:hypothetical protein
MDMTDRIASDGYLEAGYNQVSIDDCWEQKDPKRDPKTNELAPDPKRFPSGMKALGDYMHSKGVKFGIYSDEGTSTCGGYPGSKGYENIDAKTFASWGVDYLKLDGCNNDKEGYVTGYPAMGAALQASGRNITYSCSWPAYLGSDETTKPFQAMIDAGCNLWRNWDDINNKFDSISSIIDHWGDYSAALSTAAGPGHWNDPDMILVGDDHYNYTMTADEAKVQMSIWSIVAAPLIMGNDLRTVTDEMKAILLNKEVIAIDQDPAGKAGIRVSPKGATEVWARELADGSIAVALYNKAGSAPSTDNCTWEVTAGKYIDAGSGSNLVCTTWADADAATVECCSNPQCVAFSVTDKSTVLSGCTKNKNALPENGGSWVDAPTYEGWLKKNNSDPPAPSQSSKVTVNFADLSSLGWSSSTANVRDLWAGKDRGSFTSSFTAIVPRPGVVLVKLTK